MKNTGIWLDKRRATIIKLNSNKEEAQHVFTPLDEGNIRGWLKVI